MREFGAPQIFPLKSVQHTGSFAEEAEDATVVVCRSFVGLTGVSSLSLLSCEDFGIGGGWICLTENYKNN